MVVSKTKVILLAAVLWFIVCALYAYFLASRSFQAQPAFAHTRVVGRTRSCLRKRFSRQELIAGLDGGLAEYIVVEARYAVATV
jgi:hypothetical protein